VTSGITITPEVAFSAAAGDVGYLVFDDPTRGKFDTAKLAVTDYFTPLATWFRGGTVVRGTSRFDGVYGRAEAGTMSVDLANEDRRFDPTNLAGPYVVAGVSQVKAGRAARLRVTYAGTTYDLFRGFVEEPILRYRKNWAQTTFRCTDGTGVVSDYDGVAGGLVGGGEDTGARINRVLDNTGWPAEERNVAAGRTTVQSTDLSANAWAEICLTADTEIGEVYFDVDGKLVFRNRWGIITDARSATSQATFGDAGGGELGFIDVVLAADLQQTKNLIRLSRVGGTQQTAQDATSITEYRIRTWGRSDLLHQTDTEVADYAAYVLSLLKDYEVRIAQITVNPLADPANLWPQVLGRKLGDRVTVKFTPPGGGARISRDVFIRGITHDIGTADWSTTFVFQDATKFAALIFDNTVTGKLDTGRFAF
jgi:hypothetical protein